MSTGEDRMPSELGDVKVIVKEFVDRLSTIDNELETLKQDRKELIEEFADKLDMKTLKEAMRVDAIVKKVKHKNTFDVFVEVLEDI
jgi:regulator of replication initiation timing